jgi:hypothetical protein
MDMEFPGELLLEQYNQEGPLSIIFLDLGHPLL